MNAESEKELATEGAHATAQPGRTDLQGATTQQTSLRKHGKRLNGNACEVNALSRAIE
jgi:hypothetical protein